MRIRSRINFLTMSAAVLSLGLVLPASAETKDPAPVSDEVVSYIRKTINTGRDDPLIGHIDRRMDEAADLVERISNFKKSGDAKRGAETRDLVRSKAAELSVLKSEALARLKANPKIGANSSQSETPTQQVGGRFDKLTSALEQLANSDTAHFDQALTNARKVLKDLHSRNRPQLDVSPGSNRTWSQGAPVTTKPKDLPKGAEPQYLASNRSIPGNDVYAFLGDTLLAALPDPTPTEAATCSYTAADLAQNLDVQLTPEIKALAEQLQYSPVQIYQYVSNNIAYEPYFGSLKGTMGTLVSKAGGPTDQASLLIALLRASNIPARYVRGTVQFSNDDRGLKWIGAKGYDGAVQILRHGQVSADADVAAKKLWFDHVWVEACVPYGNYRGTRVDKTGHRWIPLDPSFKEKTYQDGIAVNVAFNYTAYMAKRQNGPDSLPQEVYASQVAATLTQNNTIEDVPYLGKQIPRAFDILPSSLPYQVISFTPWDNVSLPSEAAEVPDSHRYKFVISGVNLPSALSLTMPQISLSRLTLGFVGAANTNKNITAQQAQAALDLYRANGIPPSGASDIKVNAVILVDGGTPTAGSSFNFWDSTTASPVLKTLNLSVKLGVPSFCPDIPCTKIVTVNPAPVTGKTSITYTNINPVNIHALLVNAFQTSDALLQQRAERLLNSVRTISDPSTNLDETMGEYLNLVGLKFMRYVDDSSKRISAINGGSGWNGNHIGLTSTVASARYVLDLPYSLLNSGVLKGLVVDFKGGVANDVDLTTGLPVWNTFMLQGYALSALESYVWQENGMADAVSTVRGIQYAKEKGIAVLTLTSTNWSVPGDEAACANASSQCYKFTHNADSTLDYLPIEVTQIRTDILTNGYRFTIPRSHINYDNWWKGAVWEMEKQGASNSYSSGFIISGGYSGGYAGIPTTSVSSAANEYIDTGYACVNPTEAGAILLNTITATVSSIVNYGTAFANTYSNDPVNMVTGNMYHTERDIALKGQGGLPIVFERSYNSRDGKDGPLGYGWTHSFNQYLTFDDDNQNSLVDAADTDDKTNSVTWVDGSGARKYIQVTGTSTGVAIGSVFTAPKGYYFTTTRNANGTYTIREKNGMTYTFENMAGTLGQKARLASITDRNNNTLTLSYDTCGSNLCSVTDGMGRSLTFSYNTATPINHITGIKDWTNRSFQYGYTDGNDNLTSFKNPLAAAGNQDPVVYDYYTSDPNLIHSMKSFTLPRGNSMTFVYYTNGRVFKHTTSAGEATTFTYNDFRRESVVTNARGGVRRFFFDKNANLIKLEEENGAQREYTYDPSDPGKRISKLDPMGYKTSYAYDGSGNVTTITNPSGGTVAFSNFNTFNQPGKVKDARGNYILMKYDAKGNLTDQIALKQGIGASIVPSSYTPVATDLVAWTINTYDSYGNRLTSKRARNFSTAAGPIWTKIYDSNNLNVERVKRQGDKDGDGNLEAEEISPTLVYDNLSRPTTSLTADWETATKNYDAVDRVTRMTDAVGSLRDYQYDPNGNLIGQSLTISGSQLDSSAVQYDISDRKTASLDAAGNATAYLYDAVGNLLKVTNPDNYSLSFEYDAANHVVKAYDEEGHAVTKTLDLDGKPRTVTDPNGNTTSYEYYGSEMDGRLKKQIDAALRATIFDYDLNGNVISVTDNLGRITRTDYDELNRAWRVVGPAYTDATLGQIRPVTRYTYNNLGNLATVAAGRTDSGGTNPTSDVVATQMSYAYDDFGRKIRETDALGKSWTFEYDSNNNLVKTTDAKGQATQYTWAYGHQMLTRTDATGKITSYLRNPLGQTTTAQSPEVTYSYAYDNAHRVAKITDGRGGKELNYFWSPGGKLNAMADNDANATVYQYDPVGRLSGLWAANNDYVSFVYDAGGRMTEKWLPNGVNAQYTWNPDNTLAQLKNRSNYTDTAVVSQHDYSYDGVGQRKTVQDKVGVYTPPALNETYAYDPLGNRTGKTASGAVLYYVVDAANQLKEIRQTNASGTLLTAMIYDDNGNLTTKCEGSGVTTNGTTSCTGSTITNLTYDALNQLVQVDKTGLSSQTYAYDDQGRRVSKKVYGNATKYLYNGNSIHGEYSTWSKADAIYTHGPGIDDPLLRITTNDTRYYHKGGLGSVVATTDKTGAVTGNASYDAWGNTTSSGNIPQYGYTGREPDETGLIYYRARYYDPTLGRFTQRDPIGLRGGLNQYAYVGNNPTNLTDPSGLQPSNVEYGFDGGSYVDLGSGINSGNQSLSNLNLSTYSIYNLVPQSMTITDYEREMAAADDVEGFWLGRQTQSDPIADVALSSLNPSGGLIDSLFGGTSINTRIEAYSRVYTGQSADLGVIRIDLMNAHIGATDADTEGVIGLLNPSQVYDYHQDVFGRYGLPSTTFGGSPLTGSRLEADWTRRIWCSRCDQ